MEFSLADGEFENVIRDTYNIITNPSRRLITGMQGLNEMLGGGFESGRFYMIAGTSGVGKSLTLLNIIYQIKRYNTRYRTKDPTKRPCIVLLTMENTIVETINRLWSLSVENDLGMEAFSVDEVINKLRNEGELSLNESSPIDIIIKYKPNKSINTSYLYTICDDLEDRGYEVICLVQDHVKRIRSVYANSDLRLELGDIVNEMKNFAAEKDIPVISNTHLNREATRIVEEGLRKKNQDVGKLLGQSNTGESMLMVDNIDCLITISLDFDKEGSRYMTFNLTKMRDKHNDKRSYFAQPFVPGSTIRLIEDAGGVPQFRESLHMVPELNNNTIIKMSGSSTMTNSIDDILDTNEIDDTNVFKKTVYTFDNDTNNDRPEPVCPISFILDDSSSDLDKMMNELDNMIA
jgi:archaellum biogenesis ATPase FlaH